MSPEQLKTLQQLSQLFEEGSAGPMQVKQLSVLLAEINQLANWSEDNIEHVFSSH
tara:strand:- start:1056 stop:1220 length:165 start_codon:yes stop_codon:yes gene_type:complete